MAIKFLNTVAVDTDVLYVDAANNRVGIGTTSPGVKLEVNTNSTFAGAAQIGNSTGNRLYILNDDGGNRIQLDAISSGGASNLIFANGGSESMRITSSGNVGIGTTSPSQKLQVAGNIKLDNGAIILSGSPAGQGAQTRYISGAATTNDLWFNVPTNGRYRFAVADSQLVEINSSGNVGIGTTSPTSGIHVNTSQSAARFISSQGTGLEVQGGGNSQPIAIFKDTAASEKVRISSTGNVGIGNTSNSAGDTNNGIPRLQVNTATAGLGEFPLAARFTTGSDAGDNSGVSVLINSGNDRGLMISAGREIGNTTKVTLNVVDNEGDEIDTITMKQSSSSSSDTYVGIGTTSPGVKLHVNSGTTNNVAYFESTDTTARIVLKDNSGEVHLNAVGDDMVFATSSGGSQKMRITSAGNVGIGTTNPGGKLTVSANGAEGIEFFPNNFTNGNTIQHYDRTGLAYSSVKTIAGDHRFNIGTSEAMRITSAGNVGIGTTSPSEKLDVRDGTITSRDSGNVNYAELDRFAGLTLKGNGAGSKYISTPNTDDLGFKTNNTEKMRITSSGNVGIGTTAPSQKLHVAGNMRLQNQLYDSTNSLGSNNQVLTKVSAGTQWKDAPVNAQMPENTAPASAANVGTIRYKSTSNTSSVDVSMQTGATTYAWVNIVSNFW